MLQGVCRAARRSTKGNGKRLFSGTSTASRPSRTSHARLALLASSVAVATGAGCLLSRNIHNEAYPSVPDNFLDADPRPKGAAATGVEEDGSLVTLVWGSNRSHILSSNDQVPESVRTPAVAEWLKDVALRDLVTHEWHAACIDARGDVYQWGDEFFGPRDVQDPSSSGKPTLTLRGKNIVSLQATSDRVFALSASGRIYVLSSVKAKQKLPVGAPTPSSAPWWGTGWLWGEEETVDFAEITPHEKLGHKEKFVSISAGNDHMLALTSSGRTFAHPINPKANAYGQLGFRKFDVPDHSQAPGTHPARKEIELTPDFIADPYSKDTPYMRKGATTTSKLDDGNNLRYSDKLFEVPALRGIEVEKITAGGRTSFVKTSNGRVLGWGANEYGQVGLGGNVTLKAITVPTEIILWRSTPQAMRSTCLEVYAGGDLTFFKVERASGTAIPYVDVLSCGNGQWGGLGNNLFTNAQGSPVKTKAVSGLLEYSEATNNLQPIYPYDISISPTGHVLLTLDTLARSGPGGSGRDLLVWGANYEYQLGNGKKGSVAIPTTLHSQDGARFMLGKRKADVKDLSGKFWKKGVDVEQVAIAGWGNSLVYWRICP